MFGVLSSGCQKRIEYVHVQPECSLPPLVRESDLPSIDVDYVYDNLGTDVAEDLLKRERLIVDNLIEHRVMLKTICEPESMDGRDTN